MVSLGSVSITFRRPITASADRPPNAAGWYNANVVVTFTCYDKTSGVASCSAPVTVSTEGANQVIKGTAMDNAGNVATAQIVINLDKTPPIATAARSPGANARGWNNTNVTAKHRKVSWPLRATPEDESSDVPVKTGTSGPGPRLDCG